jgi:hypothetical protein
MVLLQNVEMKNSHAPCTAVRPETDEECMVLTQISPPDPGPETLCLKIVMVRV